MKKILVIEDDDKLRTNISKLLTSEGYKVDSAKNGKIGIEKVHSFAPHLIICDVMMPEMDGFEVLDNLMNHDDSASIPFIFLTAKVESEDLRKGMRLGADDYLLKPFHIDDLLQAIETRLKKKENLLKKNEKLKEQIGSMIPHQLKTPLVPIMGYADLIAEENDLDKAKEMAETIRRTSGILRDRIEKFLMYNSLLLKANNSSSYSPQNYSINVMTDDIKFFLSKLDKELHADERVTINFDPVMLNIKEEMFESVIVELVENGLKFSEESQKVELSGYRKNNHYEITIKDNGNGISAYNINNISPFSKFGDDSISDYGIGLGLAIVKRIIELNNGLFEIKCETPNTTTCKVELPLKNAG